ncbi:MAG: glycogen/starch synthase [Chloroflexota bacterium]|nr:glycogen/starch synthase [Chloroflexota bacterium]
MSLNVLFLAAEAEPFVKIGGLGDVAGALPKAILNISKKFPLSNQVDIRLALPFHNAIKKKGYQPSYLGSFPVARKRKSIVCRVYHQVKDGIPVYFLDGVPLTKESLVYSINPVHDGEKYVFFSIAALGLTKFLNWRVDVLHTNDWHTATAIYALNTLNFNSSNLSATRTVHTLHNLPFMGYGTQKALEDYGLPPTKDKRLPMWARHTPLPLGLLYADKIIAVSPHYAKDVLTPEFGCGLEKFLKTRQSNLDGILNGLDTDQWNPEIDPIITKNFNSRTLPLREKNKLNLQKRFKLKPGKDIPLLTLISRMDPQKGIDIAIKGLNHCRNMSWQAIILGTGHSAVENTVREFERQLPDRVRGVIGFDSELAHQLYAGADIFMMPSRYEPCGLSQMIAMLYGCVPIAHSTGGLADTIRHISHKVNNATGFLFNRPYPSVFTQTLKRAFVDFQKPGIWQQIQRNGMNTDFSWENSALKYLDLYKSILGNTI